MIASVDGGAGRGPVVSVSAPAGLVFLTGVGPLAPGAHGPVPEGIAEQVSATLENLLAALEGQGLDWGSVAKILLHLRDANEHAAWEEGVQRRLGGDWRPALTVVEVDNLPHRGARIQLDAIAAG